MDGGRYGGVGLDCNAVVLSYDLFTDSETGEVVAVYLDEVGVGCVCETLGLLVWGSGVRRRRREKWGRTNPLLGGILV